MHYALMTTDDTGPSPDGMLTLTDAAAHTGYSREALRQRVKRGSLLAIKGNDGMLRVHRRDLADLPPPDETADDQGQADSATADAALAILVATMADLRVDLERTRSTLNAAWVDRMVDHERAVRAEEKAKAEAARATAAETRLAAAEAALAEARMPWAVRVISAWRNRGRAS